MVSRIPEKFRGNHKAEVLKQVRGHHDKSWYFAPFLCGFWSQLAENFKGSLFPHSPSLYQVLSKSFSVPVYPKISSRLVTLEVIF